jgi:heme/copper-type cytochrome/quinol oxidase subunit 2
MAGVKYARRGVGAPTRTSTGARAWWSVRDRVTLVAMRRVLFAVLVILVVAQAGCRTSGKDEKDTQRVEHRVSQSA